MTNVLLLTDGRRELKQELTQRKKELETLSQLLHRLESEYFYLKHRYQTIDREWALRDGRLKVIKAEKAPKSSPRLTQDEINALIEEIGNLIDAK